MNQTRRWFKSLLFIVILLAICVSFLPTLLSFSFCKPFIEKQLSHALKGKVHFNQLHLSWFTSQYIEGFDYKSDDGSYAFSFKSAKFSATLFRYLVIPNLHELSQLGTTEITSPTLVINQKFSSPSNSSHIPHALLAFVQNLSILNGTFISKGTPDTELHHVNVKLQFQSHSLSNFSAQGLSKTEGEEGNFDVHLVQGRSSIPESLHVTLDNFPLAGIEAFFNKPGLFTSSLGSTLNARLALNTEASNPLLSFVASAEYLDASCYGKLTSDHFSLTKPAVINFTLTQGLFKYLNTYFSLKQPLCITRNASLQVTLDSFNVPSLDVNKLSYQAKLSSSPLGLAWCNTSQPISIDTFSLTSSSKNISQSADLTLQTSFNYLLKTPSYINAELQLIHAESWINMLSYLSMDVMNLPVALVDTVVSSDHFYVDLFGDTLTAHVAPSRQLPQEYIVELKSAQLQIPELHILLNHGITLTHPAMITCSPNRSWIAQHLDSENIKFSKTGKLYGNLETLSYPFSPESPQFAFSVNSDDIVIQTAMLQGPITLKNTTVSVKTEEKDRFNIKTSTTLLYEEAHEKKLLDSPLKIQLATNLSLDELKNLSFPQIEGFVDNSQNSLSTIFSLEEKLTKLSFLQPISMQLLPSAEKITHWTGIHYPSLSYVFSPLTLNVTSSPLFLNRPLFEQLSLNAEMHFARLDLVDKVFLRDFIFSECDMGWSLDTAKKTFEGSISSGMQFKEETPGSLAANFSSKGFSSLDSLKHNLNISFISKGISSYLLDSLLEYKNAFHLLLGNTLDTSVNMAHQGDLFNISAQAMSSQMVFNGDFSLSKEVLKIERAVECDLKLKEQSLGAFEQIYGSSLQNFSLTEPALLRIVAKSLYWPINQTTSLTPFSLRTFLAQLTKHLSQSYFHVTAQADHLHILSQNLQKTTSLNNFFLESTKETAASPLLFKLTSYIADEKTHALQGEISSTITLQSTKDYKGRPMLLSKLNGTVKHFPTALIDSLFGAFGFQTLPPSVLLGEEINATLNTDLENLSGHVDCEIDSTDSKANLNAYLIDGVLKLYKPIHATLNITPKLAAFFLNNMNVSLTLAKNPLHLFISDQGFYFPLAPFDISRVQIRQASANLGKIFCDNRGNPMEISGFFKLPQDKRQGLALWFAPMDFSLSNGTLQIDRTEVLFNDAYQIAFWGKVDLLKRYVNMVLGLTEQSLKKALGIHGLSKSFVLQIPMTGPLNNVRVNTEVATARIAFLLARSSGITDQAGLWGGIVNTMGDFANDQSTVPPSKPPFPWKEALSQYEAEEKLRSTAHIIH